MTTYKTSEAFRPGLDCLALGGDLQKKYRPDLGS